MLTSEKKIMAEQIRDLSEDEQMEIFKIIRKSECTYTENNNGIFLNMRVLNNGTLNEISKFIKFCHENKKNLSEQEEIVNQEKINLYSNIPEESSTESEDKEDEGDDVTGKEPIGEQSDSDDSSEEIKITLKRSKPKYKGIKAKLIKNYRSCNSSVRQT